MATKTKKQSGTANYVDGPDAWRAKDDMRTLAQAEEIKADTKRFAAAKKCAQAQIEELESVFGEDAEGDDK